MPRAITRLAVTSLMAVIVPLGLAAATAASAASAATSGPPRAAAHPSRGAAHTKPAAAVSHVATPPRGARPATPPRAGTGLARGLRSIPADIVGCYDGDSILSAANSRWVSAELGYGVGDYRYAMLRARAIAIGPWEQYYTLTGRVGC